MQSKILAILGISLFLRMISLNQSLWIDEATSVLVARDFSFSQILTQFSPGDFHPPLYYLMLRIWVLLFGSSEVAVRMLSVLFGVATVWLVYEIGKRWKVGELAALFLATAPLHIYYSQEARMYVPATFSATLVVYFFLKILQDARFSSWAGLTLAGALLLYTDYLPAFLFIALFFYLLIIERKHLKENLGRWIVANSSIGLLFFPWIPTLFSQLNSGLAVATSAPGWWQILGRTNLKELALVPLKFAIGRIPVDFSAAHASLLLVPLALFASLFAQAASSWRQTRFLWFWLLVPPLSAAILGLKLSVFSYFRLIFVLPAFYLLLAYGVTSFKKWSRGLALFVILINLTASSIYLLNPRFHREDWRSAVGFIEQNSEGKSLTLFVSNGQQEAYKYYASTVPSTGPEVLNASFDTIWLVRYVQEVFDPEDRARKKVEEEYVKVAEYDFNGVIVWKYENRD